MTLWARDPWSPPRSTSGTKIRVTFPASRSTRRSRRPPTSGRAVADAEAVLLAVPAQFLRGVLACFAEPCSPRRAGAALRQGHRNRHPRARCREIGAELLPGSPCAVLSGPSFAAEVARGLPTAVTIASSDPAVAGAVYGGPWRQPFPPLSVAGPGRRRNRRCRQKRAGDRLRDRRRARARRQRARGADHPRSRRDGPARGRARGAGRDVSRPLGARRPGADLQRRAIAQPCAGPGARPRGRAWRRLLAGRRSVVEGVATAAAVVELAARLGIEMPISDAVDAVLHRGVAIDEMTDRLLRRPYRLGIA